MQVKFSNFFSAFLIHTAFAFLFLFSNESLVAQKKSDTTTEIKEIVITGFLPNSPKLTSLNIEPYPLKLMNEKAPFNLCDALAKLPGIAQMTTGNAIAKPVIRGLFGNRILGSLSGLRFDTQHWQDEHGMGLSQIGINRVEIIKGPASLLYGSDAIGGVINVIEEKPQVQGTRVDVGTALFSNSRGTLTDVGIQKLKGNHWWRIRLGYEDHADFSDGANNRVLNSRNSGTYLKAGFGFTKKNWKQENTYNFSYNQFGFIMEDMDSSMRTENRWTRGMTGSHHIVMLNLLNSQNVFQLKSSLLKLNIGLQSNSRREDEGGGQISLNMHLASALENLRWEKELNQHITFVANQQFNFTSNTNYGGRIIIPDANMTEGNVAAYFKFFIQKFIIESGAGINIKSIQTFETRTLNSPGKAIQPFSIHRETANAMLGAVYNPSKSTSIKCNFSTGFRAPNLAELSSNGVHEGVYRFEIGDPNLKVEQNLNGDLNFEYAKKVFFFSASVYYNRFFNYIYLAGTSDTYLGFPVFRFRQQDAVLYGSEWMASLKPSAWRGVEWKESFANTKGTLQDGSNMPFIPAYKLNSSVRWEHNLSTHYRGFFIEPEGQYIFSQNKPAQFETATPGYFLLNLATGVTIQCPKGNWILGLNGKNLSNKKYADHLSRLKYYGLYNQGINVVFSVRKEIKW